MIWFCLGEESNSSRRVILKIELELNNLNSVLSRSAMTPVFPRYTTLYQTVPYCTNMIQYHTEFTERQLKNKVSLPDHIHHT